MKGWLLVNRGTGTKLCLKSLLRQISQTPSTEANELVMSSDSIEDLVTSPCFFEAHEIGEWLNLNIHPNVDFLSFKSPAKSASVKPVRKCKHSSVLLCNDLSEVDDGVAKSHGGDVRGTWLQLMCCALPKRLCP